MCTRMRYVFLLESQMFITGCLRFVEMGIIPQPPSYKTFGPYDRGMGHKRGWERHGGEKLDFSSSINENQGDFFETSQELFCRWFSR